MKNKELELLLTTEMENIQGGENLCSCVCDGGGAAETVVIVIEDPKDTKQL